MTRAPVTMTRPRVLGEGTPWSAPLLTRGQRDCLRRHGVRVWVGCAATADGSIWCVAEGGGRNRVSGTVPRAAQDEWAAGTHRLRAAYARADAELAAWQAARDAARDEQRAVAQAGGAA